MSTQVKHRRGTHAEHTAFAGGNAEVTVETDARTLRIHDGSTLGGVVIGRKVDFDSLTSAVSFITSVSETYPINTSISTASHRNESECLALSIAYPDGGGESYYVDDSSDAVDGGSVIQAGTKQIKLLSLRSVAVEAFGGAKSTTFNNAPAINAMSLAGVSDILLDDSAYGYSEVIAINHKDCTLVGVGPEDSRLVLTADIADSIVFTATGTGLRNLKVTANTAIASGFMIRVVNTTGWYGENFRFQNGFNGIDFESNNAPTLSNGVIADFTGTDAIRFAGTQVDKADVLNIDFVQISHQSNTAITQINWESYAHSLSLDHVRLIKGGIGLKTLKTSVNTEFNAFPAFLNMVAVEFDFPNAQALQLDNLRDAWVTNCYVHGSVTESGMVIGVDSQSIRVTNSRFTGHAKHGIHALGKKIQVSNSRFYGNSQELSNTYDGINIDSGCQDFLSTGCMSGFSDSGATSQRYGVNEVSGSIRARTYSLNGEGNLTAGIRTASDLQYAVGQNFAHSFRNGSGEHFRATGSTANSVNFIQAEGAPTGGDPVLAARGDDADIDLQLTGKGAGYVKINSSHQGTTDVPITGYVEMKDLSGTVRKFAIIA